MKIRKKTNFFGYVILLIVCLAVGITVTTSHRTVSDNELTMLSGKVDSTFYESNNKGKVKICLTVNNGTKLRLNFGNYSFWSVQKEAIKNNIVVGEEVFCLVRTNDWVANKTYPIVEIVAFGIGKGTKNFFNLNEYNLRVIATNAFCLIFCGGMIVIFSYGLYKSLNF